jgi:CRISPR-associated endonuclease/helicase Cas3
VCCSIAADVPLAHSPQRTGEPGDPYSRHVAAVRLGALARADAMLAFLSDGPKRAIVREALNIAAAFHDLGKLDPDNQKLLRRGRSGRLPWDHIDAGVARVSMSKNWLAAWLIRAHHAPGFPNKCVHFETDPEGRRLRGRRQDLCDLEDHRKQIERTDSTLIALLREHQLLLGPSVVNPAKTIHGLTLRLALSCLVDADHADTAFADSGREPPSPATTRWPERLAHLLAYVAGLPVGLTPEEQARNAQRAAFFETCANSRFVERLVACEGPVGIGKTTAVSAHLLRHACEEKLRRLFIVAPYTNILSQTSMRLRSALVLAGEKPRSVLVEHHHRVDFDAPEDRELAASWNAPIIATTAVSFFEALAGNDPATLRKLHAVPGSAIFIDEVHAALPAKLWPQVWQWLRELVDKWNCRVVLASGSLVRFWEEHRIVKDSILIPELMPHDQARDAAISEQARIRIRRAAERLLTIAELIALIRKSPSPHLVILNTVQNAAVVASRMRHDGLDVLHLSTALSPRDRERILERVYSRLSKRETGWSLIATSCVEAGVDFSFRSGFRERFSVASTLQTGGRINRNAEYSAFGTSDVYDFALNDEGITQHPAAKISADILREYLDDGAFDRELPAVLASRAMRDEIIRGGILRHDPLREAELACNYPRVKELSRVIDADTRLVVISSRLKKRLQHRKPVSFRMLLRGSVQMWSDKIDKLQLERLPGRRDIYAWNYDYDSRFLGYMAGVLRCSEFLADGGAVI